jgi:hypothetical protein
VKLTVPACQSGKFGTVCQTSQSTTPVRPARPSFADLGCRPR